MSEHDIQAAYIKHCRWLANADPRWANIIAIPNQGKRSYATAARFRAEGMSKGVPDIFVAVPDPKADFNGLFIEFKTDKGKQSQEQQDWFLRLVTWGYACIICRSAEQAIRLTQSYFDGGPLYEN